MAGLHIGQTENELNDRSSVVGIIEVFMLIYAL